MTVSKVILYLYYVLIRKFLTFDTVALLLTLDAYEDHIGSQLCLTCRISVRISVRSHLVRGAIVIVFPTSISTAKASHDTELRNTFSVNTQTLGVKTLPAKHLKSMSSNKSQSGSAHIPSASSPATDSMPSHQDKKLALPRTYDSEYKSLSTSQRRRAEQPLRLARFFADQAFHNPDPACTGSACRQVDRETAAQAAIDEVDRLGVTQDSGTPPKSENSDK
ncbi:hypothetical protein LX32DRAFT_648499 [Colletotrichum zoysiae]|uniref:Uncharacterized protein n=1 Tax=Colletotrichum zoysiae TaxID=1216348 RepID=A0AAD9HUQ2_9PEZI|nr:hypothetical protein LX32DRAFT_648499 [Colletotrichum zoysiae]